MLTNLLIILVLISKLRINCVTLVSTDTLNDTNQTTTTTKLIDTKPIANHTDEQQNINSTILETLTNTTNNLLSGYEHSNKTIEQYLGDNKLVIKSNANNDAVVKTASNGTLNVPLTPIIVVIGVVFVIIIIIISALFVMRRRFSKWRLNIMDTNGGACNLNNDDGKNSGDNVSSTNDALISKQDDHVIIETNGHCTNGDVNHHDDNDDVNKNNAGDNISNTDDALISKQETDVHTNTETNPNGNCVKDNE